VAAQPGGRLLGVAFDDLAVGIDWWEVRGGAAIQTRRSPMSRNGHGVRQVPPAPLVEGFIYAG
jgi:hypothetical protein